MKLNFLENYGENSKKSIIVLATGVVIVVGIALTILQNIWFSNNGSEIIQQNKDENIEVEKSNFKLGTYSNIANGRSLIIKEYFSDIFRTLSSGTDNEIYAKVSKNYLEKYKYSKETLYNKLKNKNVVGKAFQSNEYSYASNPRFGVIYSLEISSIDNSTMDRIIIIEEKPRSYVLSFDSYIGEKKQDIKVIRNGIELSITSVEEYRDRVYFDISIKNLNVYDVILNKNSEANEAIYVTLPGDKRIYNIMTFFSSSEIKLEANASVNARVEFLISDLQSAYIEKMCLVNVYDSQSKTTDIYEFDIY